MKIGEWDNLGRARGILQRHLGDLGATEAAAYVSTHPDTNRQRILVATDIGLLDYTWGPQSPEPKSPWYLRGNVTRWRNIQGLRLATDATWDESHEQQKSIWRLVAQEPKIELIADTEHGSDRDLRALLAFARACYTAVE